MGTGNGHVGTPTKWHEGWPRRDEVAISTGQEEMRAMVSTSQEGKKAISANQEEVKPQ
jgi:hypothetical protein